MKTSLSSYTFSLVTILLFGMGAFVPTLSRAAPPAAVTPPNSPAATPPADTAANGDDALSAERPGFTSGTDTIPLGHVQFETGYLSSRQSGVTVQHLGDGGQVRLPFRKNAEFRIVTPVYYFDAHGGGGASGATPTGFTDGGISVKWRFQDEVSGHRPALALIASSTLPTGSAALRATRIQPGLDLEGQFNLSSFYQLQANVALTRADDAGTIYDQYAGTVSVGYAVTPATNVFVQLNRQTSTGDPGAASASYCDGGVTYALQSNTQLDLNGGVGIGRGMHGDRFVGAGIVRRW